MASSPRRSSGKKASSKPKAGPHGRSDDQAPEPKTRSKPAAKPAKSTKTAAKATKPGGAAASKKPRGGSSTAEKAPSKRQAAGSSPAPRSTEPQSPSEITGVAFNGKPMTPNRRWSAWLAAVSDETAASHLIEHIRTGGHLAGYCTTHLVPYTAVRAWIAASDDREAMYARAREDRADLLADEIVAISDEVDLTAKVGIDGEERLALDPTAVARNRLRVDARKWVAAKLKPRVYGDKVAVGGDPDAPPINHSLTVKFI